MKVFIVDDEPITLTLLAFMFTEDGIEAKYALSPNTEDFIKEVESFAPDVIVLDIYLQDCNGFEIAERVRNSKTLSKVPIVAISSSSTVSDKIQAYSSVFADYVEKPFSRTVVLNAIKSYGYAYEIVKLCNRVLNKE